MKSDDIRYALAKMVPDIARRAEFHTNHGPLWLFDQDAQRVAVLVERILHAMLKREEKHAQQRAAHKARQPER